MSDNCNDNQKNNAPLDQTDIASVEKSSTDEVLDTQNGEQVQINKSEDLSSEDKQKSETAIIEGVAELPNGTVSQINEQKTLDKKKRIRNLIISLAAFVATIVGVGLLYNTITIGVFIGIISVVILVEAAVVFGLAKKLTSLFKISAIFLYVALILVYGMLILDKTGVLKQFDSTEKFVEFVRNTGGIAEIVFLIIQFAQVTLVPIPSTITTVGAQALFGGFWKPFLLATSGLVIGSMCAFWLGRVFGVRIAKWMVGEDVLNKYQKVVKGKDKFILFYMFLFPFFPDDFLCLLAGMTNMKYLSFFVMMLVTRSIGTAVTMLMAMGLFSIPFSGWGIAIWIAVILVTIVLLYYTIRYSDKIEAFMLKCASKLSDKLSLKKKKQAKELNNAEPINNDEGVSIDLNAPSHVDTNENNNKKT